MNTTTAFILGLLAGLVIGLIIAWIFWRRSAEMSRKLQLAEEQVVRLKKFEEMNNMLQSQYSAAKAENIALKDKIALLEDEKKTWHEQTLTKTVTIQSEPDDLILIKGIGPVIAKKLNGAGIWTFRELADLTPDKLREIVGDVIQRLANEEDIISQAKKLADERNPLTSS